MEAEQTPLRTAIMRIMSDMLDNPCKHGIYDTGLFMDRTEQLMCDMMAAPDVMQMSGSEAIFGFASWLTCREEPVTASARHDSAIWANLIDEFCKTNRLTEPRESFHELLTHPDDPEPVDGSFDDPEPVGDSPVDPESGLVFSLFDLNGDIIARGTLEDILSSIPEI